MEKKEFRRWLRQELTPAEKILWYALKNRRFGSFKFRRQHSISSYTVDFYCAKFRLVVELDGEVHWDINQERYDMERDKKIRGLGYQILRFENSDVMICLECVLEKIEEVIHDKRNHPEAKPLAIPLPTGEVPKAVRVED